MAKKDKKRKKKKRPAGSSHVGMKLQRYTEAQLRKAIRDVIKHHKTIWESAKDNKVPKSTLGHRLKKRSKLGHKVKTLGGARKPRVLPKGMYFLSALSEMKRDVSVCFGVISSET